MAINEETAEILRVTMRYDNLYKSDVEVECSKSVESHQAVGDIFTYEEVFNTMEVPISFVSSNHEQPNCTFKGGYAISLLLELSSLLNFKLEVATDVGAYDFANATNNSLDLFVGQYVLRESRVQFVNPTYLTGVSRVYAYMNHDYESKMRDILLEAFDLRLMMSILGISLFALLTIGILSYLDCSLLRTGPDTQDVIFEGVSVILQRGGLDLHTSSTSLHCAFLVTSICSFCLVAAFSGAIVAILTIPRFTINSLEDLMNSHYTFMLDKGYNNGSSIQAIMESLKNETIFKNLLHKISQGTHYGFETFEKSMEIVNNHPVAYIIDEETGIQVIRTVMKSDLPCSWGQFSVQDIKTELTMYMGKHTRFRKRINSGLLHLDEKGILRHYRKKWNPVYTACSANSNSLYAVSNSDVNSAYWIFLVGAHFSFAIFLLEKLIYIIKTQNQMSLKSKCKYIKNTVKKYRTTCNNHHDWHKLDQLQLKTKRNNF